MTTMSRSVSPLVMRVGRVPLLAGIMRQAVTPKRCEVVARWTRKGFATNRLTYTLRRQPFINHRVDNDGVHLLDYWGPMTKQRVMKIIESIPTDPTEGVAYL